MFLVIFINYYFGVLKINKIELRLYFIILCMKYLSSILSLF